MAGAGISFEPCNNGEEICTVLGGTRSSNTNTFSSITGVMFPWNGRELRGGDMARSDDV